MVRPHVDRTSPRELLREGLLISVAILLYFAIRNATAGGAEAAFANADRLLRFEEGLGIAGEHSIQGAIDGSAALVTLANWVYIWAHWPVILTTAVVLFLVRRDRYHLLRNAIFISGAMGFLFFALLPVAPPRLLEMGLIDTVTEQSRSYRALQPPGLTNQYAAFPSLHAGWNVVVGVVLFGTTTNLLVRAFAVLCPAAMAWAVVATANHFVIDVVAGVALVLVGLVVAQYLAARTRQAVPADTAAVR